MKTEQTQVAITENITDRKKTNDRSIGKILWNKFLDILENATFRQILSVFLLVTTSLTFTLLLTFPDWTLQTLSFIGKMKNYFFPKAIGSFLIIFNFRTIVELIKKMIPEFPEVPKGDTIDGIPTVELLDHLFKFESFKRDDIEKKFKIPRHRFTELAKKFESMGILKRGENNSRILTDEFARSDIALILEGQKTADDLRLVSRKIDEHSWTFEPAKKSIVENVKSLLSQKKEEDESSSLQFTRRKIGSEESGLQV